MHTFRTQLHPCTSSSYVGARGYAHATSLRPTHKYNVFFFAVASRPLARPMPTASSFFVRNERATWTRRPHDCSALTTGLSQR